MIRLNIGPTAMVTNSCSFICPLASSLQDSAVPWAQGIQSQESAALKPRRATACAPVLFRTEVLRLLIFLRRFDDKAMKAAGVFFAALATMCAQVPNPTQQQPALTPAETGQPMPIFRVTVVSRTISAINYHHRSGTTQIDFRGTELLPAARGEARVESQMGSTKIDVHVNHV